MLHKVFDRTYLRDDDSGKVLAVYWDGCMACERYKEQKLTLFPPHTASKRCESGGRNHCSCDVCF